MVRIGTIKNSFAPRSTVFRFAALVRYLAARNISAAIKVSTRTLFDGKLAVAAILRTSSPVERNRPPNASTAAAHGVGSSSGSTPG
jgi:hypothetical protein